MLLHRRLHSSRSFIVAISCMVISLFHQIEGFPVLVKKAGVVSSPPLLPILPNSDASWFDGSAGLSTLVTRSSSDVVHDTVFIPTIATMGALVIICIICIYRLVVTRDSAHPRSAYMQGPIYSSQNAVGQVENGHESRPPSRIAKGARGSILSASTTVPGSPSVGSDMVDRLQRRREEEHRKLQPQDPYEQYVSANPGYPQQHHQYTRHPSVPVSVAHQVEAMQPQFPHSAYLPGAQHPFMSVTPSREQHWAQERQGLQQPDPRLGVPRSSLALTSSTRVSSDVLSYATLPEARRPPLPSNSSRPQSQDYPIPQHPAGGIPSQIQPSTQGDIAHSVPANNSPRVPSTSKSAQTIPVDDFTNEPPRYSTETKGNVQGNVASNTPLWEKHKS